ncbi:Os05g0596700 [Oryza sativa Japonica Group]|uniref:Os05g0596700 protein n=2 Tax=Oryza TaxID=4527 RepID=Q5KQG4_ORYSJ|nr:unknown protein [Oryza sativa Japonica Group]BAH93281.1 Os05g0596700 [Oryza sativa Japonica Group]|eukprot:NP_001174553.1 Os05g0596700 [Oryza sativa Japonica Group]
MTLGDKSFLAYCRLGHLLPIINYHLIVSLWHLMARTCPVEFFVYNLKEDSGAIMGLLIL